MMKAFALALGTLAAVFATPTQAGFSVQAPSGEVAVRDIVTRIYDYDPASLDNSYDPLWAPALAAIQAECDAQMAALDAQNGSDSSYGYCNNDFDRFCGCQDMDAAVLKRTLAITTRRKSEKLIEVEARYKLSEDGPDGAKAAQEQAIYRFERGDAGWGIADILRRDESGRLKSAEREPLLRSIAELRKELKRPPYKVPGAARQQGSDTCRTQRCL